MGEAQRLRRLVELNVLEQVRNLAKTSIVQNALRGPNPPRLHGLVYDIADGVLKDLQVNGQEIIKDMEHIYGTEAPPAASYDQPAKTKVSSAQKGAPNVADQGEVDNLQVA